MLLDFDSTLIRTEGLEELATISLRGHPERVLRLKRVAELTEQAMQGELGFSDALQGRLELLEARSSHITELIERLSRKLTPGFLSSFKRHAKFWSAHQLFIVSGGFKEYIIPLVARWNIRVKQVFANEFILGTDGRLSSPNANNPLAHSGGKVKIARQLKKCYGSPLVIIGDGYTDYEVREQGAADRFFVFTANVCRSAVVAQADAQARTVAELIQCVADYDDRIQGEI